MGVGVIGAACRFAKSGRIENRPQPIEAAWGREILDPREVMEARAQAWLDRIINTFIINYKSWPK